MNPEEQRNIDPADYVVEHDLAFAAGNTGIVLPKSAYLLLQKIQTERRERKFKARSFLSSSYDIALSTQDALRYETRTSVLLKDGTQQWWITLYKRPIYFTLEPNESGYLQSVSGHARAALPSDALNLFKSAVIILLDRLTFFFKAPLYIQRTELYLDSESQPIVELTFPPLEKGLIQYGGGIEIPLCFLAYQSLEREALTSPSPIYRFMSRWRAFESIGYMRSWLQKYAAEIGCTEPLPKVPKLSVEERAALRLAPSMCPKAKNLEDVVRCHQDLRNAVAHFWSGDRGKAKSGVILPYRGLDLVICEKSSQIIRYCNERIVETFWQYFAKHLSRAYSLGSILPMPGRESEYCACEEALFLYPADSTGSTRSKKDRAKETQQFGELRSAIGRRRVSAKLQRQ
jgi:hypothetical protein